MRTSSPLFSFDNIADYTRSSAELRDLLLHSRREVVLLFPVDLSHDGLLFLFFELLASTTFSNPSNNLAIPGIDGIASRSPESIIVAAAAESPSPTSLSTTGTSVLAGFGEATCV